MEQQEPTASNPQQEAETLAQFTKLPSRAPATSKSLLSQGSLGRQGSSMTISKKSALHLAFKENPQPTTSHSEMLPKHHHEPVVMAKYTVFWMSKKENDKVYQILIEWPHVEIVIEAIRDVIPFLNQKLAEANSPYVLSTDPNLYEFFKAKKSGKPKTEYPSLDMNQVLSMTGIQNLTLVENTPDAVQSRKEISIIEFDEIKKLNNGKDNKSTMVKSTMPGVSSMVTAYEDNEGMIETTFCFCFKVKRRPTNVEKEKNKKDLEQRLLATSEGGEKCLI